VNDSPAPSAERAFRAAYGRAPQWIASAPGRVNLIGEFTDFNSGFVLPMAIDRRTTIAGAANHSRQIVLRSEQDPELVTLDLDRPLSAGPKGSWGNYPTGVVAGFQQFGARLTGLDLWVGSAVPPGAGLASSAALTAATATVLEAACGVALDPVRKAQLCQLAEHHYAQVPCGIMDPFISILGRAGQVLLLDCESNTPVWLPMFDHSVTVLIVNTHVKRSLAQGAYAERRHQCEAAARAMGVASLRRATLEGLRECASTLPEMSTRCARHVISENSRTIAAAQCVRESRWEQMGALMYESHDSLRDDFRVSCAELDALVDTARQIGAAGGVFGCRLTGGGFGGCAVALVRSAEVDAIADQLQEAYARRFGSAPTLFPSRPAAGASLDQGAAS
jgi:galactokinase